MPITKIGLFVVGAAGLFGVVWPGSPAIVGAQAALGSPVIAGSAAAPGTPAKEVRTILHASKFNDNNGDGKIDLSASTIAELNKADPSLNLTAPCVLIYQGLTDGGLHRYTVQGHVSVSAVSSVPAVAPARAVEPVAAAATGRRPAIDLGGGTSYGGYAAKSGDTYASFDAANGAMGNTGRLIGVGSAVDGLTIRDVTVDHVGRLLDVRGSGAKLTSFLIENVRGTNLQRGLLNITGDSANGVIRHVYGSGLAPDPAATKDTPFQEGISFSGTAHDILVENSVFENMRMVRPGPKDSYWNSDGISIELGNYNITLRRVTVRGNTDGGIDTKGLDILLDNVTAEANCRNFRFWRSLKATKLTSINPVRPSPLHMSGPIHVHVKGNDTTPPVIEIDELVIRSDSTAPIFQIEDGKATVVIKKYDIRVPKGTRLLLSGKGVVDWGPQGPPKTDAKGLTL